MADPGQLEQVLVNLAVNARDAMPDGGTLTIDTDNVGHRRGRRRPGAGRRHRAATSPAGQRHRHGHAPEVVARAFEPFFTTKPKGEGIGLGLATVYGIITEAGGAARWYSEVGIGTTFTALLPAADESAIRSPSASVRAAPQDGGETILVVEDEHALRGSPAASSPRNGYTSSPPTGARGPRDRRGACRRDPPPRSPTWSCRRCRDRRSRRRVPRPRPPVLYMSGYAQPVLASTGTLDPGLTLLEKPFTEAAFLAKARKVLEEEPAAASRPV